MKVDELSYKELQAELKKRGEKASGKKADLAKRLQDILDNEETKGENDANEEDTKMDQDEDSKNQETSETEQKKKTNGTGFTGSLKDMMDIDPTKLNCTIHTEDILPVGKNDIPPGKSSVHESCKNKTSTCLSSFIHTYHNRIPITTLDRTQLPPPKERRIRELRSRRKQEFSF